VIEIAKRYAFDKVKLGQGNFGTVWRATHKEVGSVVALKQLRKQDFPINGLKPQDIKREVVMMRSCPHDNITQLIDFVEDLHNYWIAVEYCDDGDLDARIRRLDKSICERTLVVWMRQICAAIRALHLKGICHRDVKPENVMLSRQRDKPSKLKLADFGLAIYIPPGKALHLRCGTPAFMSPEVYQLPSGRGYGFPTDMWAAGVSMYMAMFGGQHPFLANDGSFLRQEQLRKGVLDFTSHRHSSSAIQFCQSLVQPDTMLRLSAHAIFCESWLQNGR